MNLWLGLVKTQQIALQSLDEMSVDSMEKLYKINWDQTSPSDWSATNGKGAESNLNFGDRRVVLLEELELT
ncbi:MAG: hypothetical protein R3C56_29740 [Pirellulaceae bacterium]